MLNLNRTAVGLTRASIDFEKASWKAIDCRVKPGNDEVKFNPAR